MILYQSLVAFSKITNHKIYKQMNNNGKWVYKIRHIRVAKMTLTVILTFRILIKKALTENKIRIKVKQVINKDNLI
jgi:hypothetical protein